MEKIEFNGTTIEAEVLERDHDGHPRRIRYEGADLLYRDSVGEQYRWLMVVGSSPLQAARELLKADYEADVKLIADDVRERVASEELDSREDIDRFVRESCDGSYRLSNTAAQREILTYTSNPAEAEGASDLALAAYDAFIADVYDALGDIDELLAEDAEAEDGDDHEHDTA